MSVSHEVYNNSICASQYINITATIAKQFMQTGHCDYISDYMFQVKCIQLDGNELKYQTTIAD